MSRVSIDQVLACPSLPSLPAVAMEVLALASKPNINLEEIARVVQHDQALSARILKTVNSSFYGLPTPCPTITRAISLLGLSTVKSLVLGFSLVDSSRASDDGFDLIEYWRRNLHSAAATRCIVKRSGTCDPEEAFIAALMQDIGMPAIYHAIGHEYQAITVKTEGDHNRLLMAEVDALGFNHAEVGSRMAQRWHLPGEIVEAIRRHHSPDSATAHQTLVRAVALGTVAAAAITEINGASIKPRFINKAAEWFSIDADTALAILKEVEREAKELSRLFRINISGEQGPSNDTMLAQAEEIALQHQLSVQREAETLRETNSNLSRMTVTDALTNIGNRKHFDTELQSQFEAAHAHHGCLSVFMVDADRFKTLNDTHGHQAGDTVLIELARRMKHTVGETGLVCRYGGEEFTVIMPGTDRRTAARMAEQVRLAVCSTPIEVGDEHGGIKALPVTVSIGVASLEPHLASRLISPQLLLRAADKSLYAAKDGGRNCVRVFTMSAVAAKPAAIPVTT